MVSFKSIILARLAMAPLYAHAHMIMANPVPYGNPNNSPLDASGSDFPCKAVPYTVKTMNEWKIGSTQTLAFTGTAEAPVKSAFRATKSLQNPLFGRSSTPSKAVALAIWMAT
jgi:hypothetical protein